MSTLIKLSLLRKEGHGRLTVMLINYPKSPFRMQSLLRRRSSDTVISLHLQRSREEFRVCFEKACSISHKRELELIFHRFEGTWGSGCIIFAFTKGLIFFPPVAISNLKTAGCEEDSAGKYCWVYP